MSQNGEEIWELDGYIGNPILSEPMRMIIHYKKSTATKEILVSRDLVYVTYK